MGYNVFVGIKEWRSKMGLVYMIIFEIMIGFFFI